MEAKFYLLFASVAIHSSSTTDFNHHHFNISIEMIKRLKGDPLLS